MSPRRNGEGRKKGRYIKGQIGRQSKVEERTGRVTEEQTDREAGRCADREEDRGTDGKTEGKICR